MKHTAGPWKSVKTDLFRYKIIAPELKTYPNTIARLGLVGSGADVLEGNARLIELAPDMIEALKDVQTALINWRNGDETVLFHKKYGALNLEEVRHCVVDPILSKIEVEVKNE